MDGHLLLEERVAPVDLVGNGSSIDLNLHNVSSLLAEVHLTLLSVNQKTDDLAVLGQAINIGLDGVLIAADLLLIFGEGFLFGTVPVLVESAQGFLRKMFAPDGVESTEAAGSFHITNHTDHSHLGSFDDGHGFQNFLLVKLRAGLVDITDNVGHTSLEASEGSQVGLLGLVILRIGFDASAIASSTLTGQESQTSMARSLYR